MIHTQPFHPLVCSWSRWTVNRRPNRRSKQSARHEHLCIRSYHDRLRISSTRADSTEKCQWRNCMQENCSSEEDFAAKGRRIERITQSGSKPSEVLDSWRLRLLRHGSGSKESCLNLLEFVGRLWVGRYWIVFAVIKPNQERISGHKK